MPWRLLLSSWSQLWRRLARNSRTKNAPISVSRRAQATPVTVRSNANKVTGAISLTPMTIDATGQQVKRSLVAYDH